MWVWFFSSLFITVFILLAMKISLETGSKESAQIWGQVRWGAMFHVSQWSLTSSDTGKREQRLSTSNLGNSLPNSSCPAGKLKPGSFPITPLNSNFPWLTPSRGAGLAQACWQAHTGVWCYKGWLGQKVKGAACSGKGVEVKDLTCYVEKKANHACWSLVS